MTKDVDVEKTKATIQWRVRIKYRQDGTCEAEVRTNQGVSLCKRDVESIEEAFDWIRSYVNGLNDGTRVPPRLAKARKQNGTTR